MGSLDTVLGILTGICLSAACGFRVFVPLLVMNLAAILGNLHFASGFEWIGSPYATVAFSTATVLEILAYKVPWLDNILDAIASPVAVVAGIVATASVITEMPPALKWVIAIIAGGGIAGIIQGATTALRLKSSLFTGGLANPLVSAAESGGAIIVAVLAMAIPAICLGLIIAFIVFAVYKAGKFFTRKR